MSGKSGLHIVLGRYILIGIIVYENKKEDKNYRRT